MIDPKFLYVVIAACLCLGLMIGYILRGFFQKNAGSKAKSEPSGSLEAEELKKDPQDPAYKQVARLWFDTRDRRLIFQIGEEYFKRADDLSPKDRVKLIKVVSDFYRWLEPDEVIRQNETRSSQPNPSGKPDSVSIPAKTTSRMQDENSPKMDPSSVSMLSQAPKPDVSQSALFSQSMISQVDAILQEKIHQAGMEKWAIRLTEFPQQGMVVMVGLEKYNGIDEVPYERVRSIIRESVLEWEQRADLGSFN